MPKLEIRGNGSDGLWILAVANFPNDGKLREDFYAIHQVEQLLADSRAKGYAEIESHFLDAIIAAPSREQMKSLVATATKGGIVAGHFLLSIFILHRFPKYFSEPSRRKAIALTQAFARRTKRRDKSPLTAGETTITKYFDEFNSVAHLWAAFQLLIDMGWVKGEMFGSDAAVRVFLKLARRLQDFGCEFVPKRAKPRKPILDRDRIWDVQADAQELTLPWTEPPEWMISAATKYKARTDTYRDRD